MSLDCIAADLTAIRSELKSLTKIVRKIKAKQEDPDGEKAKKRAENNGFNRKQKITEKLATFLGLEKTELVSRSEVTKSINKYITEKGLKHPENGRVLVMDDKLKELLQPGETQVTYLNLHKFLSPHYVKEDKA